MKSPLGKSLRIVCLVLLCASAFAASVNNPYNREFGQIENSWDSADPLHKLVFLDRLFRLRDYIDDAEAISPVLDKLASQSSGLVREEADAYLNDINVLEGRSDSSRARHWRQMEEMRTQVLSEAGNLPPVAENLELLAELESVAGVSQAGDHMQQAARLSPNAHRWQRAAELTDDPFKKFSALQSALALDPSASAAQLDLATYYVGRQQLEKADALLQKALVAAPDDFVVGEHLVSLYLNLGMRSMALQRLRELEQQFPSPLWLQSRLAIDDEQIGLLDDAARLAQNVVRHQATDRELLQLLARFHDGRHMMSELQSDYVALLRMDPNSADLWFRLAELQLNSDKLPDSIDSFKRVAALDPGNAEVHRQLSEAYSRQSQARLQQNEIAAYKRNLRDVNLPVDVNPDLHLLVDARELAQDTSRQAPKERELTLADVRVQELYGNGLTRLHVQQITFIGSEAVARARSVVGIRYSPETQSLRVLHARAWKQDGSFLEAEDDGDSAAADASVSMYYDLRSHQLHFPSLESGDVVELEYSLSPVVSSSPYPRYFGELVTMAGHTPALLRRYAFIAPSEQAVFAHAERLSPARTTVKDGLRTMVWDAHDVAARPNEPGSPGPTEVSPYVHVSTFADWQSLGSWYAGLIRSQFTLDAPLRSQLEELLAAKTSDLERIAAIQDFVLRSTHYVALEFGVHSYKPYSVSQTYARRFGDCKDKAALMIALLQAAGIDAEIALVRTRPLGEVVHTPASMAIFDHAVVYVPRYSLWLDGTAEYSARELPLEDQGALALTVSLDGVAELREIPMSSVAENYTRRTIRAQISRQGKILFHGSTVTRGEGAPVLRRELSLPEQQLDVLQQRLAQVIPAVRVESVAVHEGEYPSAAVNVDFDGVLNAFERKGVVTLGSSWMRRNYMTNLAPASSRTQDLMLAPPWTTEEDIYITLPPGATIRQLPEDQQFNSAFGSGWLHYRESGHEIVIQSRLQLETTRIKASEYAAFRQFCFSVQQTFGKQIVVDLPR